ncbi:soluble lytic transglycosylase B [Marinobacterium nitratireducens]|uniref:Soluble lytic transglycosylase B n=1 Tax=Marinobacterium nitratireducens TaxID=518897 RepID=A0A918DPJ2_9GAMM|nr:lytic murein transglycosylase B [Marinobacterium nitratireducens]GGO78649.1 soluble lytic transglycosylase B [Marinobacterium nitratireducens]
MRKVLAPAMVTLALVLQSGCASTATGMGTGYANHPDAQPLINELVAEGFDRRYLEDLLGDASRQESILKAMSRPAERRLNWGEYRKIFIEQQRIDQGVQFWRENAAALARAEREYGVPAEIIVAIIGVETRYGRITGSYRVIDALATLGFDYPKRGEFFQGQLKEYVRLVQEEQIDPLSLKGSYAGAMGYGQFIPSSYRAYAVDFDGDHKRDIWNNKTDAIGSVANYFAEHGWKNGEPVLSNVVINKPADPSWFNAGLKPEVSLAQWRERGITTRQGLDQDQLATLMEFQTADGEFYRLGLHNFYVITRYNHSRLYAMAVYELSQLIRDAYGRSTQG